MRVAVVGAGKMGLPTACQFAACGASVMACDVNPQVVESIRAGKAWFEEPGVSELLATARREGRIDATTNISEGVRGCEVVVVLVPVLLTPQQDADLSIILDVTHAISNALAPGMMVCYETTLPPGTTRHRLRPVLESAGLRAGEDFDLVFSPERVKSQLVLKHLTSTPKIVGGVNARSAQRASAFYGQYLGAPVINVETLEAAEFAKLAGMIYRDLNIAIANELAAYAEAIGVDFSRTREAANTDGEAFLLSPGIGVGGHCTPVYPHFVLRDAERRGLSLELVRQGRAWNDHQAARLLDRLESTGTALNGKRVAVLGLGFRPQVKEHSFSSAFLIRDAARERGAEVLLNDPLYSSDEIRRFDFQPLESNGDSLGDVVILNTAHPEYRQIDFDEWRRKKVSAVIDGRNFWSPEKVRAAGLQYIAPGVP
jgi:nucleotide sugar dehydrogenase